MDSIDDYILVHIFKNINYIKDIFVIRIVNKRFNACLRESVLYIRGFYELNIYFSNLFPKCNTVKSNINIFDTDKINNLITSSELKYLYLKINSGKKISKFFLFFNIKAKNKINNEEWLKAIEVLKIMNNYNKECKIIFNNKLASYIKYRNNILTIYKPYDYNDYKSINVKRIFYIYNEYDFLLYKKFSNKILGFYLFLGPIILDYFNNYETDNGNNYYRMAFHMIRRGLKEICLHHNLPYDINIIKTNLLKLKGQELNLFDLKSNISVCNEILKIFPDIKIIGVDFKNEKINDINDFFQKTSKLVKVIVYADQNIIKKLNQIKINSNIMLIGYNLSYEKYLKLYKKIIKLL